ncbi:MAG: lysophospholipid acyltransferase family protein [Pseudomonadota bacterium]
MNFTWQGEGTPEPERIGALGLVLVILRGVTMMLVLLLGIVLTLVLRPIEGLIWKVRRPLTAPVTQNVFRIGLWILGLRRKTVGRPMQAGGAVVANHSSWLDILVLNAGQRIVFVSKAEVAGWPVIGWLARLVDTAFIRRNRHEALAQAAMFRARMERGQKLLFFPEGTSTDGMRVLPFKSTLFEAFFADSLRDIAHIQPVTVVYQAPDGAADPRYYGWWGDMDLGPHALQVLATARQGRVKVIYHPPVAVADFDGRKSLATHLEAQVRSGMPPARQLDR